MHILLEFNSIPTNGTSPSDKDFEESARVGVEVELENCNTETLQEVLDGRYWVVVPDGSLKRNGLELLFPGPLGGDNITKALDSLQSVLEDTKSGRETTASQRTSIHVHIDTLNMKPIQVCRMLLLYILFEKGLYNIAGADRYYNNNCLPVSENLEIAEFIILLSKTRRGKTGESVYRLQEKAAACGKYLGLNVQSIWAAHGRHRRGTVEVRIHEGTKDVGRIKKWIKILLCLKRAAMDSSVTLRDLPMTFSEMGPTAFIESIFGELSSEFTGVEGFEMQLYEGIRNVEYILEANNIASVFDRALPDSKKKKKPAENFFRVPAELQRPPSWVHPPQSAPRNRH